MSAEVLIVKNIRREGPGLLEQVLDEDGITFEVIDLDKGDVFPDPTTFKALVVLGGPDSANDTNAKMTNEIAQIKKTLDRKIPYLGICLGLQMLVKAADGKITKSKTKEAGFRDPDGLQFTVEKTKAGRDDPLLAGLPDALVVFQLHGETVELSGSMQLLGTGKWCQNQIVRVGRNAYGIQSHFEVTPEMLAVWAEQDPDLIPIGKDPLLAEYKSIQKSYVRTGTTLFRNFLKLAGF